MNSVALIKGSEQSITDMIRISVFRCKDHCFGNTVFTLKVFKIFDSVVLLRETVNLTFTIILLDGIVPNCNNTALKRHTTNGKSVG